MYGGIHHTLPLQSVCWSAFNSESSAADWHAAEAAAKFANECTSSFSATNVISSSGSDVNMRSSDPASALAALGPFCKRHHDAMGKRTVAKNDSVKYV